MPVHPQLVDGGHIAFKWLTAALTLGACAGASPVNPVRVPPIDNDVMATVLASQLPSGASACAVAQPRRVPVEKRPLLLPLTAVDPMVWSGVDNIDVYAEAQQRDRMGAGASVRLFRFRGALTALRAYLADELNFDVRWDEAPTACRPDHCVISARQIAPHVVRFDRGLWSDRVAGVEARCVAMARAYPRAAEVSFRGPEEMAFSGGTIPLLANSARIDAGARVVRLVQRDRMDSVEAAQVLAQSNVDLSRGRRESLGGTQREQSGNVVISTTELTWDDLRVGIADRQRETDNRRYAELVVMLEADDGIDPRHLSHAIDQLRARVTLLEHEPTSETLLRAAVSLGARIQAANPTDIESAFLLATLYVKHTHEPDKAQPLIDRHAPADPRVSRWRELGRIGPPAVDVPVEVEVRRNFAPTESVP